jgi:hypothetical protein
MTATALNNKMAGYIKVVNAFFSCYRNINDRFQGYCDTANNHELGQRPPCFQCGQAAGAFRIDHVIIPQGRANEQSGLNVHPTRYRNYRMVKVAQANPLQ